MHMLKRFAVTIVGVALLALGAAMMVPARPGHPRHRRRLALLATEYVWARRMLKTAQAQAEKVQEAAVASPVRTPATLLFGVLLLGLGWRWCSCATSTCRSGAPSPAGSWR
jgi:hypothetical protein